VSAALAQRVGRARQVMQALRLARHTGADTAPMEAVIVGILRMRRAIAHMGRMALGTAPMERREQGRRSQREQRRELHMAWQDMAAQGPAAPIWLW